MVAVGRLARRAWIKDFSAANSITFALLIVAVGAYILYGSRKDTRRFGPHAGAQRERRWGLAILGIGLLLLGLDVARRFLLA